MPHVRRRLLVSVDVTPAQTQALIEQGLGLTPPTTGDLTGPLPARTAQTAPPQPPATLPPKRDSSTPRVAFEASSALCVPYFDWLVRGLSWFAAGHALRHAAATLSAATRGEPPPPPPRRRPFLPPPAFSAEHARRLAAVALVGALANFSGSLLTQNGDAVTDSFGRSDEALGFALALSRIGVLFALVAG